MACLRSDSHDGGGARRSRRKSQADAFADLELHASARSVRNVDRALPEAERVRSRTHGTHSSREQHFVSPSVVRGRRPPMRTADGKKRLWILLCATVLTGFLILGFFGREVYRQAPPIPERIVTTDGTVLATRDDILTGQQVWQSTGGQQLGSIWGHGAYQAPDWTADWLHREAETLLDGWSMKESGLPYARRNAVEQAALKQRLVLEVRTNTFDPAAGAIRVSQDRADAIRSVASYYDGLFGGNPELTSLRESYAM